MNDRIKWHGCDCPECNPPRRNWRQWLDACPGGLSTVLALIAFTVGMWALWAIWNTGQVLNTAIKG